MDLTNVVSISKGQYVIHNLDDLKAVAKFATPGVRVLCLANHKRYIMTNVNQWAELSGGGSDGGSSQDEPSSGTQHQIVNELPATGEDGVIYLVPSEDGSGQNIYNEYMYINNQWELIGSTTDDFDPIDLETIDNYFRE